MPTIDRRALLGTALDGLTTLAVGTSFRGRGRPPAPMAGWKPDTLFLTWRRDPTTTMTVQWIAPAATDIPIGFTEAGERTLWQSIATVSHDVAPPGGRAAVPRRDRGDRAYRRYLHDAEAPTPRRRPERLINLRHIRLDSSPCGNGS